jgi:hypothetical protein
MLFMQTFAAQIFILGYALKGFVSRRRSSLFEPYARKRAFTCELLVTRAKSAVFRSPFPASQGIGERHDALRICALRAYPKIYFMAREKPRVKASHAFSRATCGILGYAPSVAQSHRQPDLEALDEKSFDALCGCHAVAALWLRQR